MEQKNQKLDIFNRYFKPLLFLTVVIILVGAYFLLLSPLITQTQNLSQNVIQAKEDDLAQQKKLFNELSQLNNIYNQVSPALKERAMDFLPPVPALPDLYYNLDQIAREAGYAVSAINIELPKAEAGKITPVLNAPPSEDGSDLAGSEAKTGLLEKPTAVNPKKNLKEIKITLSLSGGGYLNLKSLLNLMEHNLRIIDVESFAYTPEKTDMELILKTYYYQ